MKAYRGIDGGVVFTAAAGYFDKHMELPCGQCWSCRLAKTRDWAIRCVHEAQMTDGPSSFITLTYDAEHLPGDNSINVRDWQLFAKRLRKALGAFRFLHCGEYGEERGRAHYHALLFGIDFHEDRLPLPQSGQHTRWSSQKLEEIWGKGRVEIGSVTFDSAAYCARYALKKVGGLAEEAHYQRVDADTGEIFQIKKEYATMSRRPGLGTSWFEKYWEDVYPDDFVVMKGQKMRPPKFYDGLLEKKNPELLEKLKLMRRQKQNKSEETYERREVRRKCLEVKTNLKARTL